MNAARHYTTIRRRESTTARTAVLPAGYTPDSEDMATVMRE